MTPLDAHEKSMDIVTVDVTEDEIKKQAEIIASWKNSYETYIWLLAEMELRLAQAFVTKLDASGGHHIKIDRSKIVERPAEEAIRQRAKALAAHLMHVQDIHWFLAERQVIFNKVLGR
ncbi:MAG: hypothetical protein GYA24_12200 [Candidatus Lokiarchaeota archaeon]|nr:hypothetical protein [Candidatus Lokiarchaeota archaeon]